MSQIIASFILLMGLCYFLWIVAGFLVLVRRVDKLAKMRGTISFTGSIYELTFWPVMLRRLHKFEAKDGKRST